MKRKKIAVGTPCYTGVMDVEVAGKMGMYLHNFAKNHPEYIVEWYIIRRSFVHSARNKIVEKALKYNMDYIWWVDDDCIIPTECDILHRLIQHDKDIVVTPYYLRRPPHQPGVLRASNLDDPSTYYNLRRSELKKGLIEIDGGGTHCMLTKIDVFKKIPKPYFALPELGGTEDMYMCLKAKKSGFKVYCDSDIEAGHVGYAPTITSETHNEWCDENDGEPEIPQYIKEGLKINGKNVPL